jgi:hypothetical protein
MQLDPRHAEQFRPNSIGYYATIAAFCTLGGLAGRVALIDRHQGASWLLVAVISATIALALASVRITVAPHQIAVFCLGASRAFPVPQIDRRRFDELVPLNLFRLSLRNGRFVLIPRAAFATDAPFAAIEAVAAVAPNSSVEPGETS